jgi:exopolysaccharide biosynthesis predicted pyruvyltransferase EpsI
MLANVSHNPISAKVILSNAPNYPNLKKTIIFLPEASYLEDLIIFCYNSASKTKVPLPDCRKKYKTRRSTNNRQANRSKTTYLFH